MRYSNKCPWKLFGYKAKQERTRKEITLSWDWPTDLLNEEKAQWLWRQTSMRWSNINQTRSEDLVQYVRFQVLTAARMKIVFWDVTPCSLVVYQHFWGAYCLHHQGALMMDAASTSERSVNLYQTTRRNIPEDSHLLVHYVSTNDFTATGHPNYATDLFIVSCNTNTKIHVRYVSLYYFKINFKLIVLYVKPISNRRSHTQSLSAKPLH
jgi:hypothetical protein